MSNQNIQIFDKENERIKRIRRRFLDDKTLISLERAKFYTEKWSETENSNLSVGVRIALCMKNVYENMQIYIDPDDRIAGKWTESFLGIPLDLERGIWNRVLEYEIDEKSMKKFAREFTKSFIEYMSKKGINVIEFIEKTKKMGTAIPTMGSDSLEQRKINGFKIKEEDKELLLEKLIPYWKGKNISDLIEKKLLENNIYKGDFYDFINHVPIKRSQDQPIISSNAVIGGWQGHIILDHETAIKKGLLTMQKEVREEIEKDGNLTKEQIDFLKSLDIALEGIMIFANRLTKKLQEEINNTNDPKRKAILTKMYKTCNNVKTKPAKTFREAVQLYWIIKTSVDLALPFNVHGPGRLDQFLYPYYKRDIEGERITREEAIELLEELVLKVMSHNIRPYSDAVSEFSQRYEGSEPITLGGLKETGEDATNELTYIILEVAARSKTCLNFAVRFHDNSPEELYLKVADLSYNGISSLSMLNDNIAIKALMKRGLTKKDAQGYCITGCVDMSSPGKTGGISFSAILLSHTLDTALRNGDSRALVGLMKNIGPKTGEPELFRTFEDFLKAFYKQSDYVIQHIVEATKIRDQIYAEYLPAPFLSAFVQGCLKNKKDVTQGGAKYDAEGILILNSVANLVDSLYVIKKLVFEEKKFTLRELVDAVDNNFIQGYEWIHSLIMDLKGKWGNGNPECDELAKKVTNHIFEETYKYKTYKGGVFAPFIISMTSHTYDGRISLATPDGRLAGKPFAASCNPYNVEEHGPTGVLRSVAALDYSHVCGCAVNIRMHPSGIGQTEEARKKWISLIKTYFKLGGEQLQPTVVSTKTLRAAQKDPEKYRDIIVKVGGYSAYFTDLGKEIQDEVISRTEHR
jgi:formate C-acetyltransferase